MSKPILLIAIVAAANFAALAENAANFRYEIAPPLPGATVGHTATVLNDGKILVTGGLGKLFGLPIAVDMARLYVPAENKWRPAQGRLNQARLLHGALLLPSGQVLIAGGLGPDSHPIDSLELYHSDTQTFTQAGTLAHPRADVRLNELSGGRILVTGGGIPAEILELTGESFKSRPTHGKTSHRRNQHACVELPDGRVLLIGGRTPILEIFDPKTELFHVCQARLPAVLDDIAAALLYDGAVLIAGGQDVYTSKCINRTWRYDPITDKLHDGPTLSPTAPSGPQPGVSDMGIVDLFPHDSKRAGRYFFLCGGEYDPGRDVEPHKDVVLDSAWVYDAAGQRFIDVGPMPHPHDDFAVALLPPTATHARVLIIAGYAGGDKQQNNCDFFLWPKTD